MPTNLRYTRDGYPRFFWTQTYNVAMTPYFIGLQFRKVADVSDSRQAVRQIRLGLIWWHFGVTFISPR